MPFKTYLTLRALFISCLAQIYLNKTGWLYKNRHLVDTARYMLMSSSVPSCFWSEAIHTVAYLINRITIVTGSVSPYER